MKITSRPAEEYMKDAEAKENWRRVQDFGNGMAVALMVVIFAIFIAIKSSNNPAFQEMMVWMLTGVSVVTALLGGWLYVRQRRYNTQFQRDFNKLLAEQLEKRQQAKAEWLKKRDEKNR